MNDNLSLPLDAAEPKPDTPSLTAADPVAGYAVELGLTVDHRRLFGAVADGWLHPLEGSAGQTLGVGRFVRECAPAASGHRIGVRLALNASKLPDLDAFVRRNGDWTPARLRAISRSDDLVHWPGAIPTFAVSALTVASAEAKAHLVGLSRSTSNIDLSDMQITVADMLEDSVPPHAPPSEACNEGARLEIPPGLDAIHGALAMAMWAVPRIDPWLDVLRANMSAEPLKLRDATTAVDAAWWRLAPWRPSSAQPETLADCLWLAASDIFRHDCNEPQPARPRVLLARIAELAKVHDDGWVGAIAAWQESTERILAAEATVQLQRWRANPVGLAIQLVLTRPEPDRFKTWFKDMPDMPPGVAWSAATLCGLLNGYRRLAAYFRGDPLQREILAVKALSVCSTQSQSIRWPSGPLDLRWRRENEHFVLSHGDKDFACKAQNARGRWYAADLKSADNRRIAKRIAADLAWPCLAATIRNGEALPYFGPGKLSLRDGYVEAEGEVTLHVANATFDDECFRRCVATECGKLPVPPMVAADVQPKPDVPGLVYKPDFLDEEHERRLVEWIDTQAWSNELKRRVQHYGWRYEYKGRKVDPSMRLGELPAELLELAERLYDRKLVPQLPDQVIVNEYQAGQGISVHMDAPGSFADGIATISLLESWEMNFHAPSGRGQKANVVPRLLERRSVAVMNDDARWKWKHEIRARKSDPPFSENGKRRPRERRISLTFRKVLWKPDH